MFTLMRRTVWRLFLSEVLLQRLRRLLRKLCLKAGFIEASREKVKQLMERPLGELRLCAVLIDGTPFKDRHRLAGWPTKF